MNIDFISKTGSQGEVANHIQANSAGGRMDVGLMKPWFNPKTGKSYVTVYTGGDAKKEESYKNIPVTNSTLRRDEWKHLDAAVMAISESRLGGIQDLIDKGLTYNLGNAMGTTVLETHDSSDAMEADMTMDGVSRGKGDRINYETKYLPIPIIHVDYEINSRVLDASRNMGNPLDTTSVERATRKVLNYLETLLFTAPATAYAFGGGTIYSYLNHPDRNLVTLSDYGNWDDSAASARDIFDSVLAMKQAAITAKHYGPYQLYIPTAYETVLDEDYEDTGNTATNKTIRQRLMDIEGINGIKVIDTLTADNVLLVQMTSDVVRLVRGMGIQNVEWQTEGKFVNKYKVMTIQVPQVRSDQEGNSGIIHMS